MNPEDRPLVSILMTAYNRENYIAEAIESVLKSSYENFELIIVDDNSIYKTASIAKEYCRQDKRVKLFLNKTNLGDYPNRNKAASYATGGYLMTVDSDDMIYGDSIQKCVHLMIEFPGGNFGMLFYARDTDEVICLDAGTAIKNHFFKKPFLGIGPGGTIIKRSFFYLIGGYPEKYGPANDMYFNIKAAARGGVILFPFEIVNYRVHEGQEKNNSFLYLYNNYNYMNDAIKQLPLQITEAQKKWLLNKNKRRFLVNIRKFFFKTYDIRKTSEAIKKARFTINDLFAGVFH